MISSESFYRIIFLVAAIINIFGSAVLFLLPGCFFVTPYMERPVPPLYYQSWLALASVFGIGYYFVYKNMQANKNIVIMGAIAKAALVIIFTVNMLLYPGVPKIFWVLVCYNAVFVILFLMFLACAEQ